MAMGKRGERQELLFVATEQLARGPGHPFYQRLNGLLDESHFDRWVEQRCQKYYEQEEPRGRKSIAPGLYFRMLLVGYYENIDSQRGIAWRCADSLALRRFLGVRLDEDTPDHSTLTNTRKRLPEELFLEVFQFVLAMAEKNGLISGKTAGVDSTTLEANAAMKSIVRKDTGEDWQDYVKRLMRESGAIAADAEPSAEEIRRFDQKRKDKTASNEEWESTTDADARITKMKDGRTHLAYKAEHVVDLKTDVVLAAEIYPADHSDMDTLADSVVAAKANVQAAGSTATIDEVVADKGYHSAAAIETCEALNSRTYIPEKTTKKPMTWEDSSAAQQHAAHNNRQRMTRDKGKKLQRRRSEVVERTFAHICDTGGARRSWLRGLVNVNKRYLIAAAAHNLGRLMRLITGIGKPKTLQGQAGLADLTQLIINWLNNALRCLHIDRNHWIDDMRFVTHALALP
jgi:transposase